MKRELIRCGRAGRSTPHSAVHKVNNATKPVALRRMAVHHVVNKAEQREQSRGVRAGRAGPNTGVPRRRRAGRGRGCKASGFSRYQRRWYRPYHHRCYHRESKTLFVALLTASISRKGRQERPKSMSVAKDQLRTVQSRVLPGVISDVTTGIRITLFSWVSAYGDFTHHLSLFGSADFCWFIRTRHNEVFPRRFR